MSALVAGVGSLPCAGQSRTPQAGPPTPSPSAGTPSDGRILLRVDGLWKRPERSTAFTFITPNPEIPVYRARVEAYPFQFATWQQNFVVPRSKFPQPFGGADYYEMQRLITPASLWAIKNRDALGMLQTQVETAAGLAVVRKLRTGTNKKKDNDK